MKINKDQSGRSISWLYVLVSFVLAFFLIKTLAGSSDTTAGASQHKVENPGTGVDLGNQTAPTAMVTELVHHQRRGVRRRLSRVVPLPLK